MSTIASRAASSLCWIATLPLAYADADVGEGGNLIAPPSGSEIAVRGYGAAQVMRDNSVIATVALITTTVLVLGSVFGLLRPSMPTEGPSAEPQQSIGATTQMGCNNLIDMIPDAQSQTFRSLLRLKPTLKEIEAGADSLLVLVTNDINSGTQAPSLESLRQCIDVDLKTQKMKPLRDQFVFFRRSLNMGELHVTAGNSQRIRQKIEESINLANGIIRKLQEAVDKLTTEIDEQRAIPLPRIG